MNIDAGANMNMYYRRFTRIFTNIFCRVLNDHNTNLRGIRYSVFAIRNRNAGGQ